MWAWILPDHRQCRPRRFMRSADKWFSLCPNWNWKIQTILLSETQTLCTKHASACIRNPSCLSTDLCWFLSLNRFLVLYKKPLLSKPIFLSLGRGYLPITCCCFEQVLLHRQQFVVLFVRTDFVILSLRQAATKPWTKVLTSFTWPVRPSDLRLCLAWILFWSLSIPFTLLGWMILISLWVPSTVELSLLAGEPVVLTLSPLISIINLKEVDVRSHFFFSFNKTRSPNQKDAAHACRPLCQICGWGACS